MAETTEKMTFEEAMTKLETIVSEMEQGGIPLEEMMAKFEQGSLLAKYCQEKLGSLKKKMEILTADPDGSSRWREMTDAETMASPETEKHG